MRIPINALKEFSKKYGLDHVIVFATEGKTQHVATYGETIKGCDQAAQFGDKMKDALGWPESLHAMPNRVKKLNDENKELISILKEVRTVCTFEDEKQALKSNYGLPLAVWNRIYKALGDPPPIDKS